MSGEVVTRCQSGRACEDVAARVLAAHKAKYLEGHGDCAAELLATARRIAELHNYGQAVDLEDGVMSAVYGDWLDMLPGPVAERVQDAVDHALDDGVVSVFEVARGDRTDVLFAVPDDLLDQAAAMGLCQQGTCDLLATGLDEELEPLVHVFMAGPALAAQLVAQLIASVS